MSSIDKLSGRMVPLGAISLLFGILLLAYQGTELLKQLVLVPGSAAELGVDAACPLDELEEEGLSLAECQLMASSLQIALVSRPDWFRPIQIGLSLAGIAVAVASIIAGMGLVGRQAWAVGISIAVFAALLVIDIFGFIVIVNTGPLLRAQYLWQITLWVSIHLCLLLAALRND